MSVLLGKFYFEFRLKVAFGVLGKELLKLFRSLEVEFPGVDSEVIKVCKKTGKN